MNKVERFLRKLRQRGLLQEESAAESLVSKYGAEKTTRLVNGAPFTFDSRREARRYDQLCLAHRAGAIGRPLLQVKFALVVEGAKVTTYIADFVYVELATRQLVIEDAKGFRTRVYQLKRKLFRAIYGAEIQEV